MANATLLASDNFASGSLAAGWSKDGGSVAKSTVVSQQAVPVSSATRYGQLWTGVSFPNDQISEIVIGTGQVQSANNYIAMVVRGSLIDDTSYSANIVGSQLIVYRTVNGVVTQLSSTVSGLTIAAGDIWTFEIAGTQMAVYQNYVRRFYYFDGSITSGLPGCREQASTTPAQTPIAAWRGYSLEQQDGIWIKKGIAIPALNSDNGATTSVGIGLSNISKVFFDGTVYYCWGSAGPQSASARIYYFTSPDGVNWTYGNGGAPVLTGYLTPAVILNGSTYYMYVQPGSGPGTATFALFTSTDRINWTLVSTTVLARGAGGQWDDSWLWSFNPITINAGTWYAIYSAAHAVGGPFNTGLATSSDGITWTKYGSNPVLSRAYATQAAVQVGGIWYVWVSSNPLGRRATFSYDPADTIRYQTTDFITWTNPVNSVHCSQLFEAVNTTVGQCYANAIIEINGSTYMYTTSSHSDPAAPALFQIGYAIAPIPISQLITQSEDGVTQLFADTFTTPGAMPAGYSVPTGGTAQQVVAGNKAEPTALSTWCQAIRTGETYNADQYAEFTIATIASGCFSAALVRYSTSALSGYVGLVLGPTGALNAAGCGIYRQVSGTETLIGALQPVTPAVGDVFRLTVVGNVLSLYQNGYLVDQVQDNTFASGSPGFRNYAITALTNAQSSRFASGNTLVSISGNAGVAGVTISWTGTASGTTTTDSNGNYAIQNLANGPYTITPSKFGYSFNPVNSSQTVAGANITGVNFTATAIPGGGNRYRFGFKFGFGGR